MKEREFSDLVLSRLDSSFDISEEVRGVHFTGKRVRVDAVITPKDYSDWKNKELAFGIEFKKPEAYMDATKVSSMIKQAYDYSHSEFEGFGKLFILVCPLKVQSQYATENEMQFLRRVLGKFRIGEIINTKEYLGLAIRTQDHFIWSERGGVEVAGRNWML